MSTTPGVRIAALATRNLAPGSAGDLDVLPADVRVDEIARRLDTASLMALTMTCRQLRREASIFLRRSLQSCCGCVDPRAPAHAGHRGCASVDPLAACADRPRCGCGWHGSGGQPPEVARCHLLDTLGLYAPQAARDVVDKVCADGAICPEKIVQDFRGSAEIEDEMELAETMAAAGQDDIVVRLAHDRARCVWVALAAGHTRAAVEIARGEDLVQLVLTPLCNFTPPACEIWAVARALLRLDPVRCASLLSRIWVERGLRCAREALAAVRARRGESQPNNNLGEWLFHTSNEHDKNAGPVLAALPADGVGGILEAWIEVANYYGRNDVIADLVALDVNIRRG